jgi:hypothetical protein
MLILFDLLAHGAGVGHSLRVCKHGRCERGSAEGKRSGQIGSHTTMPRGLASTHRSAQSILRVVIADRNSLRFCPAGHDLARTARHPWIEPFHRKAFFDMAARES